MKLEWNQNSSDHDSKVFVHDHRLFKSSIQFFINFKEECRRCCLVSEPSGKDFFIFGYAKIARSFFNIEDEEFRYYRNKLWCFLTMFSKSVTPAWGKYEISTVGSEKNRTFICELMERYIYLRNAQKQLKITIYGRKNSEFSLVYNGFWNFWDQYYRS